jgi:4'-phosphopantetheinyl transferase
VDALAIATMNVHAAADSAACGALVVHALDAPDALFSSAKALLDDDERARAERFVFDHDRRRYVIAHAQLRRVLARELDVDPRDLRFEAGSHGKPEIAASQNPLGLRFNLSHSRDLALIGWTRGHAIGVDIEVMRAVLAEEGVARRFFSPREQQDWLSAAPDARTRAFFNCWTRKEAFIKAVGRGLSYPLDSFDVTLLPADAPAHIRDVREAAERARVWGLGAFEPRGDAVAAVVIEDIAAPVLKPAP